MNTVTITVQKRVYGQDSTQENYTVAATQAIDNPHADWKAATSDLADLAEILTGELVDRLYATLRRSADPVVRQSAETAAERTERIARENAERSAFSAARSLVSAQQRVSSLIEQLNSLTDQDPRPERLIENVRASLSSYEADLKTVEQRYAKLLREVARAGGDTAAIAKIVTEGAEEEEMPF